jgi:hypothetical protein
MSELRAGLHSVYDYAAFYGSMLVFGLLCLSWSVLALPINYRLRLGRRFDPSPDVDAFVAELESYFHTELQRGPSCQ